MRTTLGIDDDVLAAAKVIARQRNRTLGQVVSNLARESLHPQVATAERIGVALLPVQRSIAVVSGDVVNALRDESP